MKGGVLDTSVWIEYFKANPHYFSPCQQLLEKASVYTLEIIFAELLQGAKGKREVEIIRGYYESLPKLDRPNTVFEAGAYSQKENLVGKGIGLVDAIIIHATVEHDLKLWTLDKKIKRFLGDEFVFSA